MRNTGQRCLFNVLKLAFCHRFQIKQFKGEESVSIISLTDFMSQILSWKPKKTSLQMFIEALSVACRNEKSFVGVEYIISLIDVDSSKNGILINLLNERILIISRSNNSKYKHLFQKVTNNDQNNYTFSSMTTTDNLSRTSNLPLESVFSKIKASCQIADLIIKYLVQEILLHFERFLIKKELIMDRDSFNNIRKNVFKEIEIIFGREIRSKFVIITGILNLGK